MDATQIEPLARKFSTFLAEAIGEESIREAVDRNRSQKHSGICHSHDFCDANMVMESAFEEVIGRSQFNAEGHISEEDMRLWNAAWDLAKEREFFLYGNETLDADELDTILFLARRGMSGRITAREITILVEAYRSRPNA